MEVSLRRFQDLAINQRIRISNLNFSKLTVHPKTPQPQTPKTQILITPTSQMSTFETIYFTPTFLNDPATSTNSSWNSCSTSQSAIQSSFKLNQTIKANHKSLIQQAPQMSSHLWTQLGTSDSSSKTETQTTTSPSNSETFSAGKACQCWSNSSCSMSLSSPVRENEWLWLSKHRMGRLRHWLKELTQ